MIQPGQLVQCHIGIPGNQCGRVNWDSIGNKLVDVRPV